MKENVIMSTAYNVLMEEGYRPMKEKPCPEFTLIFFKSQGYPLIVASEGDNFLTIDAAVQMPYDKEFGRLDLYKLVNEYKCLKVTYTELQSNKKNMHFVLRFQSIAVNSKDIKEILTKGIDIITSCLEELEQL